MDVGLLPGQQVDVLGVAAALDVEDAAVGLAVVIVADQVAVGVGDNVVLPVSDRAKADGDVGVLAFVGRQAHRRDVALRAG